MKIRHLSFVFSFLLIFSLSCNHFKYPYVIWLNEFPFGILINQHGLPLKNKLHDQADISIQGVNYARGLVTLAPSDISVSIGGSPCVFEAVIGIASATIQHTQQNNQIDTVEYPGTSAHDIPEDNSPDASVIFKVFADGNLLYQSKAMTESSRPKKIRLILNEVNNIRLVAVNSDVPTNCNAIWAMAHFRFTEDVSPASFQLYSYPSEILYNHSGYKPNSLKTCLIPFEVIDSLYVYDSHNDSIVFRNTIDIISGDFGKYLKADFTDLHSPGSYYLKSAENKTENFLIDENIYKNMSFSHLVFLKNYMEKYLQENMDITQQSANSLNPVKKANPKSAEVEKHAFICPRQLSSIAQLLHALVVYYEHCTDEMTKTLIRDEIQRYNHYLTKFKNTDGSLIPDYEEVATHLNANIGLTDNGFGNKTINPVSTSNVISYYEYALAQAKLSRLFKDDPDFSKDCLTSALTHYSKAGSHHIVRGAFSLGAALGAATELFKSTGNHSFSAEAGKLASELMALADKSPTKPYGFFRESQSDSLPAVGKYPENANWPLTGLCMYLTAFPDKKNADTCKIAITNYCHGYIMHMANNNAFKFIPYGLYVRDQHTGRRSGSYFYRYFYEHENGQNIRQGTNVHTSSTAAGLIMASQLLAQSELKKIAQNQFDWIYGANPLNSSLVSGWGHNAPPIFPPTECTTLTHEIQGGVLRGIGSDLSDTPALFPGHRQTSEFSLAAVANLLWLTVLLDDQ